MLPVGWEYWLQKLYDDTGRTGTTGDDLHYGQTSTDEWYHRGAGTPNPAVRVYRDPHMDHTNFTSSPVRYFHAGHVWAWFKAHPRTAT